jgi:DNA-directed RNA polymerase subunit beta'
LFPRELRDENSLLKRNDKNVVVAREVITATGTLFTRYHKSIAKQNHLSLRLFQETTKVLNEAVCR